MKSHKWSWIKSQVRLGWFDSDSCPGLEWTVLLLRWKDKQNIFLSNYWNLTGWVTSFHTSKQIWFWNDYHLFKCSPEASSSSQSQITSVTALSASFMYNEFVLCSSICPSINRTEFCWSGFRTWRHNWRLHRRRVMDSAWRERAWERGCPSSRPYWKRKKQRWGTTNDVWQWQMNPEETGGGHELQRY